MSEGKFDPHRRLCPDGACIGVIGDDGRCRVCGRTGGGKSAAPGFTPAAGIEDADADADDDDGDADADEKSAGPVGAGALDPNRRLCPDGGCIGLIGADGVCNVCGQKAD